MTRRTITVADGKYSIDVDEQTGTMLFYRNGEPWDAGNESYAFSGLVASLVARITELEDRPKTVLTWFERARAEPGPKRHPAYYMQQENNELRNTSPEK